MQKKNNIKVCLSPSLFPIYSDKTSIVVVVDILRATSAICTALDLGVTSIIPVSTIEDALDFKDDENHILAAERNGKIVSGFDIGNSPTDYLNKDFKGNKMVLTTTNGTRAINIAKRDHEVVIGAFLNIGALTQFLIKEGKDVIILCAGWKDDFCLEDSIFAGALSLRLANNENFFYENDSTINSIMLYEQSKNDLFGFLSNSQHRKRLAHLGIEDDVQFCLEHNKTSIIPILINNEIVAQQ